MLLRNVLPVNTGSIHIALCLDIDFAASQFDRKTCILSALTDSQRKLMIRYNDEQAAFLFLAWNNSQHFCRRQCVFNQFADIFAPLKDIDFFAMQLINDYLHTLSALTDARTDRVNIFIMRIYGHLSAFSRFTGNCLDLDDSLINFRNFFFKQTFYKSCISSGNKDLCTLCFLVYFNDHNTNALTLMILFIRHLLVLRHHRQCFSNIDNAELFFNCFDGTDDHFVYLITVFFVNDQFFRFTNFLFHDILCQNDRSTAEFLNIYLFIDQIAQLIFF